MEKIYETIACIKKAFPEGIEPIYLDLIACLKDEFTEQNLAALLSYLSGKEPSVIQNDIRTCNYETIPQNVMQALIQAGYQSN